MDHNIQAFYCFNGEYYYPVLDCSCGFSTGRGNDTWEDAGREMDEHIRDIKSS